jgi:competence protein ComEA helix-hairpin-helix repeat region
MKKRSFFCNPLFVVTSVCLLICIIYITFLIPNGWFSNTELSNAQLSIELSININEADWEELSLLPGIGSKRAMDIVAYREQYGPFQSIQEIQNVPGIGPSVYSNIETVICV